MAQKPLPDSPSARYSIRKWTLVVFCGGILVAILVMTTTGILSSSEPPAASSPPHLDELSPTATAYPTQQPTGEPTNQPTGESSSLRTSQITSDTFAAEAAPSDDTGPAFSYTISLVTPPASLGASDLYIFHVDGLLNQTPIPPSSLRPPNSQMRAHSGQARFGDIRGPNRHIHLGSDYAVLATSDPLVPPAENALLVATVYVEANTYAGVAIDISGESQLYLVTIAEKDGPQQYLVCYTHLAMGSNERARTQALANNGHVETAGTVSTMEDDEHTYSDLHIAVINVPRLYQKTGEEDLEAALYTLFLRPMSRTNQSYQVIFMRPESVIIALEEILSESQS